MDLPDLVLLEVFSLVNVQERLGTVRRVCRRWKQLAGYLFRTQGALIVYRGHRPFQRRWSSDNRPLSCTDTVSQSFFHRLLTHDLYRWIKKLYLYQLDAASFKSAGLMVRLVDCMCQLEELSIDRLVDQSHRYSYRKLGENIDLQRLRCPNLRVLSVKQKTAFVESYSIIAPRLERLIVWGVYYSDVNLSHPERLKYLQCEFIDKETRKFCNLEHLIAQHVRSDFDLSHFSKLKRLDLCLNAKFSMNGDGHLSSMESLLQQRRKLNLNHLEITNFGVPDLVLNIEVASKVNKETLRFDESYLEHLLSVYPNFKVEQLPWIGIVYYPVRLQDHRQLASLCSRINLQVLRVHDGGHNPDALHSPQPDPALLIRFLTELGGISRLIIGNCSFDQMFYDRLNEVPFIGYLHLTEGALPPANLGFICGIKSLTGIYLDHDRIPLDSFWENVNKTNIIEFSIRNDFLFTLQEHRVLVEFLRPPGRYKVFQFDNLDDAFNSLTARIVETEGEKIAKALSRSKS